MIKKTKKVLLLFSSSEIGGAERSLGNMAIANKDQSVIYQIATFGFDGHLSDWIKRNNKECYYFNYKISFLIRHINLHKPDIVYVIGFRLSVILRFYCKFFSKNYIVQGVRWNPISKSKLDAIFRLFERYFSFLLDGFIVNSKSTEKTLISLSNTKVKLIYNGISNQLDYNKDITKKNYVITLANLSKRKGYKAYLKVIKNIVIYLPDSKFIFLGNDNLNGQIQELIKSMNLSSNVKYLGFQENVGKFLNQSSIFVLPSEFGEGCPTSILEAFSFRLPVIAYSIDGIPELVSQNVDGILIDKVSNNSLEDSIVDLLSNPQKAKKMGENGYQKVQKHFLISQMIEEHNSFFRDLK